MKNKLINLALAALAVVLLASCEKINQRIDTLDSMIQSVTIVPAYSDGSVKVEKDTLYLDCIISPVSAVSSLTKANFTVLVNKVLTKAVDIKTISITDDKWFSKNPLNGTVSLKVPVENYIPESADSSLTAAVNVKNGISNITTEFVPVYVVSSVKPYVIIEAKYDGEYVTPLKWYRQNLAITASGQKAWKGGNATAVKVPGTNGDVIVGDCFQWAASYNGYKVTENQKPDSLLIYTAFANKSCGDSEDKFTFIGSKQFQDTNAPYYSSSAYTKYNATDSKTTLESSDDVANIILGGTWRMPTSAEIKAMKAATYWAWDATDKGYYVYEPQSGDAGKINGEKGSDHTYNKSDALLFFPAAGYGNGTNLFHAGDNGYYWSSSFSTGYTGLACDLDFNSVNVVPQSNYLRYFGHSVRPVSD